MIRAVLFDLGGTLHVSDNPEGRDVEYAARLLQRLADYEIRLDTDPASLAVLLHKNAEDYKHASEKSLAELPQDVIWSEWYLKDFHIPRERLAPYAEELSFRYDYDRVRNLRRPHVRETMEQLRGMGMRTGIISNIISTSVVNQFLREYGISEYMECEILSSITGIRKPSPGIFRAAEAAMGLRPEELAYVGDTLSRDVLGCRNAGWRLMIQIRNPSISHRDAGLENSGLAPDYLIEDLLEVPAIIESENKQLTEDLL